MARLNGAGLDWVEMMRDVGAVLRFGGDVTAQYIHLWLGGAILMEELLLILFFISLF